MKRLLEPYLKLNYWQGDAASAANELISLVRGQGSAVHVVTLTAEMLLHATEHPAVSAAIIGSDFIVADTISVAGWLKLNGVPARRVTGIDLAEMTIRAAHKPSVALIGGANALVRSAAARTILNFGGTVVLSDNGPHISSYDSFDDAGLTSQLNSVRPEIILVAFGHGKQEWWIAQLKKKLEFAAIIIGVGGTLDVWGGQMTRAPQLMRTLGLEWLWRLIQEPRRIKRILTATIIFPYRAIRDGLL